MQDSEFNKKVVPWNKYFADDVDSKNAAVKFTSDHLEKCRKRFEFPEMRWNPEIHIILSFSRSSYVSRPGMMLFVGFLLLLFVLASAWNQIDFEIFEFDNKPLYKLVNFVGGMFRSRKDEN